MLLLLSAADEVARLLEVPLDGTRRELLWARRTHGIEPHTYLVDLMQRIPRYFCAQVCELTPVVLAQQTPP